VPEGLSVRSTAFSHDLRRGFYKAGERAGDEVAQRGNIGGLLPALVEAGDPVAHGEDVEDGSTNGVPACSVF
jgi:hypothetical protein